MTVHSRSCGSSTGIAVGTAPSVVSPRECGATVGWLSRSFAPEWFEDASAEAVHDGNPRHRYREIIFSACVVEAYLFEWVRDEVLGGEFYQVNTYFPAGKQRSITERWRDVTRQLHDEQLISRIPNWGTKPSQDFKLLVRYRNGLVHGSTSRPYTTGLPEGEEPFPSDQELMKLPQGWAVNVVVSLIEHVHKEVGTLPPAWLHR